MSEQVIGPWSLGTQDGKVFFLFCGIAQEAEEVIRQLNLHLSRMKELEMQVATLRNQLTTAHLKLEEARQDALNYCDTKKEGQHA